MGFDSHCFAVIIYRLSARVSRDYAVEHHTRVGGEDQTLCGELRRISATKFCQFSIGDFLMHKKQKIKTFILSCLLLVSANGTGCINLTGDCVNEILRVHYSPSKQLKAIVFQRDCGATTGFSTQISIISANSDLPNQAGNVFVSDTDHGKSPSGPGGGPPVEVEWNGETSININYDNRARVFLRKDSQNGITIKYSERTF